MFTNQAQEPQLKIQNQTRGNLCVAFVPAIINITWREKL